MSRQAAPKAKSTVAEGEGTPVSRTAAPKANTEKRVARRFVI